jgi:hypothetical protein
MISIEDVKAQFTPNNYEWFDSVVESLDELYRDRDVHFASFVAGYVEVLASLKEAYKKEPLLIIESLDGNLPKEFNL